MKKVLFSLMALAIALSACKKEEQIVPEIKADKTEINVPVTGTEDAEEDVFIVFTANVDWTASVQNAEWLTITPAKGTPEKGKIKLIAEASTEKDPRTAVVVVTAGTAKKEFKVIQGQVDAFSLVEETASIDSKGGEVSLKVMTNIPYNVTIPAEATWVKEVTTKAYGEQVTKLSVEAFDELDGVRTADIKISATGFEDLTFKLTQNGPQTKIWGIDLSSVINHVATYTKKYLIWNEETDANDKEVSLTMNTFASLALYDGNLVVCAGDGSKPVILDKKTGEKKGELNTGDIEPITITNDEAGNLVFCNRVNNWWSSYVDFSIWYMTPGAKSPTLLVSSKTQGYANGPSYIGYSLSVRGDVTKDAAIVSPLEGANNGGENMVLAWEVKSGKVGNFVKQKLTGFEGLTGWYGAPGYWSGAPNNSPAYALLGTKLSDGAIMGLYSENIPYYVDADGKCTKLIEKAPISSNNAFNTMEIRSINGKPYAALAGDTFFTYSTPEIHIVDVATKEVVFTPTTSLYTKDLIGNTGGDVTMEAAEGGLNIYYIANNASAIEAFHCPLK